jgi:hypothetical protein
VERRRVGQAHHRHRTVVPHGDVDELQPQRGREGHRLQQAGGDVLRVESHAGRLPLGN